ncbi:acyl-protein synthetase [Helicobacter saguini]|uniref:Acyl-protein synthetase n=2 Tax=Helicobacter saguini TaxID=1548018 RepID=A0A347VUA0_9HELI|nr:acyl-protein synthetase [Helicobacter saguini]MWV66853.1 acyl-protein synthetase [Helicobacter saguini]MWV69202.1 acyl-protein synthetase [Helicobacter saguini]MWV71243.1 acyl-protein synthetase [Helicobacter saguini]TLD93337.1 acyl-protein synthetase [Helicobacter saguini]
MFENYDINALFDIEPFSLLQNDKEIFYSHYLESLCSFHYQNCKEYKKILNAFGYNLDSKNIDFITNFMDGTNVTSKKDSINSTLSPTHHPINSIESYPFLPVRLFKEYDLKSIDSKEILKTMTSSGTSGQSVSKIYLDKKTSSLQTKALTKIMQSFLGKNRLPMIIIDSENLLKNRAMFSARGAGVLGFSMFGSDKIYALDSEMKLKLDSINAFLAKHKGEKILLFGFTFIIWLHFVSELQRLGIRLNIKNGVLIHGGGWKKILNLAVSKDAFKATLRDLCGIESVHDYYGMVEQTGSIFVECERGHLHASIFSDIITRRSVDFSPCDIGEMGILEVISLLPHSYPGHLLLSEDLGSILGVDNCPCGRKGKYFEIKGRIKNAEIRGCSDTYQG